MLKDTGDDQDGADATEGSSERPHPATVFRGLDFIGEPHLQPEVGQAHKEGQKSPEHMDAKQHRLLKETERGMVVRGKEPGRILSTIFQCISI